MNYIILFFVETSIYRSVFGCIGSEIQTDILFLGVHYFDLI